MGKVSQEIDVKYGGEDDLTPKIERKDENIENLESCDLRVEEKNINFVEHVKTQNSSNNFENNCMEKLKDISTAEQKHLEDEIESNTQLAMMSYQEVENKCEQGLELRSRLIGEDNTTRNAIEVYTGFKKINYLDIQNVHRKLVIHNLPSEVNEDELKQYFLTILTTLNPYMKLTNPILNIEEVISNHGTYYIFDLATKDDIEILKAMNNTEWRGYRMRIEKPANFYREYNASQGKNVELKELKKQGQLHENDNKLYMGGIPLNAKENEIRDIVESFGQLKSFNLVKDQNSEEDLNRGFCFFEYVDDRTTDKAIKGLHGREMGDKRLKVQRANINLKSMSIVQQLKANPVEMIPRDFYKSNFSEAVEVPEINIQLNIPVYSSVPSRVIQMINMITPEDIMDDSDYREIIEDIRNECNIFGTVLNVEIPRPDRSTSLATSAVGKIFVKFSTLPSAKKARYNLSGRKFNRKTVVTSFYPENYFDVREFNYQG